MDSDHPKANPTEPQFLLGFGGVTGLLIGLGGAVILAGIVARMLERADGLADLSRATLLVVAGILFSVGFICAYLIGDTRNTMQRLRRGVGDWREVRRFAVDSFFTGSVFAALWMIDLAGDASWLPGALVFGAALGAFVRWWMDRRKQPGSGSPS